MQRMRIEGAPGLVPWRGKGRSGTGVFAWCLSGFVGIEYRQPNDLGHPDEVIKSTPGTTLFIRVAKSRGSVRLIPLSLFWSLEGSLSSRSR